MKSKFVFTLIMVAALLAGLVFPGQTVRAEAPPPPADGGAPPAVSKTAPSAPEEPAEENDRRDQPPSPPRSAPDAVSGAVQGVFRTDGALTDLNGNPVPLASELAKAMLANGIYICPAGVLPTQMGGSGVGCKDTALTTGLPFASLTAAINDARVMPGWTVAALANNYTDPGGLTIDKPIQVVGEIAYSTIIKNAVRISKPNVTLKDFTVEGRISSDNLNGPVTLENLRVLAGAETAIFIDNQNGNVTLRGVSANNNAVGAIIFMNPTGPGTINIVNSTFNNCTTDSPSSCLYIVTQGPVKLENVSANGNLKGSGASIFFGKSLTIKNGAFTDNKNNSSGEGYGLRIVDQTTMGAGLVTINNLSARNNDRTGLRIEARGNINLTNTTLLENKEYGVDILPADGAVGGLSMNGVIAWGNTLGGVFARVKSAGPVNIQNSRFNKNTGIGLNLTAGGTLTLKNVTAVKNTGGGADGLRLDNTAYATAPRTVSMVNLELGDNGMMGMQLLASGAVTLNHLTVYENPFVGIQINNCWSDGTKCRNPGGISLLSTSGLNTFWDNTGGESIVFASGGAVTLNGVLVENGSAGVRIQTDEGTGNVSLTNVILRNGIWRGLQVMSGGSITLARVRIENFNGGGAELNNDMVALPRPVTITSSHFDRSSNGSGLVINSLGTVLLNNVSASFNNDGAYIATRGPVTVASTLGGNLFRDNDVGYGLKISTQNAVNIKDVDASGNQSGAGVDVSVSASSGAVTLNNVNANRSSVGVLVRSLGLITVNKVTASQTTNTNVTLGGGARLDNSSGSGTAGVTVTNSEFNGNGSYGLNVLSRGAITLNHVSANLNLPSTGSAVRLLNCNPDLAGCTTLAPVSILSTSGRNQFDDNTEGLYIITGGNVTLNGVSASGNSLRNGATLVMGTEKSIGNLTISNSQFNWNWDEGLQATLKGTITLNNVEANNNYSNHGALLNNTLGAAPRNITISRSSFNGNNFDEPDTDAGLKLVTAGNVTLNQISASHNRGYGAKVEGAGLVTLLNTLGDSSFNFNAADGLNVTASGKISLIGLTASHNTGGMGISLNNTGGIGDVLVTSAVMLDNSGRGLSVTSKGLVTLSRVNALKNGGVGVFIDNRNAGTAKPVTLLNVLADYNNLENLKVDSRSNIILNAVSASFSINGIGARLNNDDGGLGTGSIQILSTLGANRFEGNRLNGLTIATNGAVTISRAAVNSNGSGGAVDGLLISVYNTTAPVTITCSVFSGNTGSGIEAVAFSGTNLLTLRGVLVGGNTDPVQVRLPAGQTFKVFKMACP